MKKWEMLFIAALMISVTGFGQKDNYLKFSIGAELGIAAGGFSDTHSVGFGATAQLEIPIQENLMGTATSGIFFFKGRSIPYISDATYPDQTIIPIRVGVKYFIDRHIYGAFQAGVGILGSYHAGAAFAYSPQIGYEFESKSRKSFDVTLKFDGYTVNGGYLGLRFAKIL